MFIAIENGDGNGRNRFERSVCSTPSPRPSETGTKWVWWTSAKVPWRQKQRRSQQNCSCGQYVPGMDRDVVLCWTLVTNRVLHDGDTADMKLEER